MRRVASIIIIGIIAIAGLVQSRLTLSYPIILSFSLVLIVYIGITQDYKFLLLVLSIPVFCNMLVLAFGIDYFIVLANLSVLVIASVISRNLSNLFVAEKEAVGQKHVNTGLSYSDLKKEQESTKAYNWQLDRQASEIANLYELTKKMSAELDLEEIVKVLSDFIMVNFRFSQAFLFMVAKKEESPKIERVYRVGKSGLELGTFEPIKKREQAPEYADKLLLLLQSTGLFIQIPSENQDEYIDKLSLPPKIKSFVAIPIYIKHKLRTILVFENINVQNFDRLLILADQLCLEIEKADLYAEVQELAIIDGLTGVYVRRHFLERFKEELERSKRHDSQLSLLLFDLDFFKEKNDTFGHLVGDAILKEVADILKRNIREVDLVARYGGEEFVLLLTDTGKHDASQVGERIRAAIEQHIFKAYDEALKISISAGVASFPEDGKVVSGLVERADVALYRAKSKGRNRICIYSDGK